MRIDAPAAAAVAPSWSALVLRSLAPAAPVLPSCSLQDLDVQLRFDRGCVEAAGSMIERTVGSGLHRYRQLATDIL